MGRNTGRSAVPGHVVAQLVAAAVARLTKRHPAIDGTVRHMLPVRANARLVALHGTPVPITSVRSAHGR